MDTILPSLYRPLLDSIYSPVRPLCRYEEGLLTGPFRLAQICIALGYGPVPLSKVQLMSEPFTQSLNHLFSVGEAPGVLPVEQGNMNLYMLAGTS